MSATPFRLPYGAGVDGRVQAGFVDKHGGPSAEGPVEHTRSQSTAASRARVDSTTWPTASRSQRILRTANTKTSSGNGAGAAKCCKSNRTCAAGSAYSARSAGKAANLAGFPAGLERTSPVAETRTSRTRCASFCSGLLLLFDQFLLPEEKKLISAAGGQLAIGEFATANKVIAFFLAI